MDIEHTTFVTEADSIRQICEPLKLIGIDDFFYMRVYNDETIIDFATHIDWGVHFFDKLQDNFYSKAEVNSHFHSSNQTTLWQDYPDNLIWKEGRDYFKVGNGLTIIRRSENYNESFSFFSKKTNNQTAETYIGHTELLEKFIDYFKQKAQPLILKAEQNKLSIPRFYKTNAEEPRGTFIESIQKFLEKIDIKKNIKKFSELTQRECECLYWTAQGKTAEEVGMIINSSKRTVETHLNSVKEKTDTNKLTALIYYATKQGLI